MQVTRRVSSEGIRWVREKRQGQKVVAKEEVRRQVQQVVCK